MRELNGIIHDLPEAEYHRRPELSSTGARKLLVTPATFDHYRKTPQPPKEAFDLGTAAHTKVLGIGAGVVAYPPEHLTASGNVSTSKATVEWAAQQRAAGFVPVSPSDAQRVDVMAEAVLAHPVARALLEGQAGSAEASVFATDPETGVAMRARFDYLPDLTLPEPVAVDVKTTAKGADKVSFERTVKSLQYEVQDVWYDETLTLATGLQIPFVFVVVETAAPHLVAVHQLDSQWKAMGRDKTRRARERFAECTASGIWPGYPEEVQLNSPPVYAVYQHEEEYA